MAELTFSTRGHNAVLTAWDSIKKAQEAAEKGAAGVNEKLKLTAKEARALDKLNQDIARRNETAADRYVRKLEETKRALAGHKNEATLLRKETTALTVEYLRASDGSAKWTKANKAAAAEQARLNAELEKSIEEMDASREAFLGAFGDGTQATVGAFAKEIAAIAPLLVAARRGYADFRRDVEQGREAANASAPDVGELKQLANSQGEFDKLLALAERLQRKGAALTRGDAMQATFSLGSVGATDEASVALFEQLGQKGVVRNIGSVAKSMQTYRTSFSEKEAGSMVQMLSKSFKVAEKAPGTVEDVMEAIAGVGSIASPAGISDEEVGAAIGKLAESIGHPAEARTALESFIFSTEEHAVTAGRPLMERVQIIEALQMNPAQLKEMLGRKEAFRAYSNLLLNVPGYEQLFTDVQGANSNRGALDAKLAISEPVSATINLANRRKAVAEQSMLGEGAVQEFLTQVEERVKREARDRVIETYGDTAAGNTLANIASGSVGFGQDLMGFTNSPTQRAQSLLEADPNKGLINEEERRTLEKLLEKQNGQAERQTRLLESINDKTGGGLIVGGN